MNHPQREDWVPYLFGEATSNARQELSQHFQSCAECRAEFESWKHSLGRLNAWHLPRTERPHTQLIPAVRWAFGTALVLLLGVVFMLGRLSSNGRNEAKLKAVIFAQVSQELRAEFDQRLREGLSGTASATLKASAEQARGLLADYDRTVRARLEAESVQRISDCLSLKKDVDTIAVNADASLRDTEQRLAQLAVYRPPLNHSSPSVNDPIKH